MDKRRVRAFVFGSRVKGGNRCFSDIDVGLDMSGGRVPAGVLLEIRDKLSESDIPYMVDLVDFSNVGGEFKNLAMADVIDLA